MSYLVSMVTQTIYINNKPNTNSKSFNMKNNLNYLPLIRQVLIFLHLLRNETYT